MPKRKMDARVWYRDGNGAGAVGRKVRGVELGSVVEVMGDRWGTGMGWWGVL